MNDGVEHKWLLLLDKKDAASSVLISMEADYWRTYLGRYAKILVRLNKIMYGFKEAAYWWNKAQAKVFLDHHGYKRISKDQCVVNLRDVKLPPALPWWTITSSTCQGTKIG